MVFDVEADDVGFILGKNCCYNFDRGFDGKHLYIKIMPFKILILVPYYNRPILLRNAMRSVLQSHQHHPYWEMAFGDDGSVVPGRPVVERILRDHLDKITFVQSGMSFKDKINEGLIIGRLANEAIAKSQADAAIILGDDDELAPTYLRDLAEFFLRRPEVLYCYSKIHLYNPLVQTSDRVNNIADKYNQWEGPIDPVGKVDASQVAWRLSCCRDFGARFADSTKFVSGKPWLVDTDKSFFQSLFDTCGLCHPSGLVAQFKGVHDYQLLWHKNATTESLLEYDEMIKSLAGVRI